MDPDNPSTAVSVPVVDPRYMDFDAHPVRVVATSTGKAFISVFMTKGSVCKGQIRELDLTTLQVKTRTDAGIPFCLDDDIILAASPSGNKIFVANRYHGTGEIAIWNAQTNTFSLRTLNVAVRDAHITDIGGTAVNAMFLDSEQRVRGLQIMLGSRPDEQLGFPDSADPFEEIRFGEKLHPSGNLLYVPTNRGVDIIDAHRGIFRMKIYVGPYPPKLMMDSLVIDDTGKKIFYLTAGGMYVLELPKVPLGIGELEPSQGGTAGGTTTLIHGSGFTSATTVSFGKQNVPATFVDANTLRVTTPAMPSGSVRVTVSNPDGETYYLDAGFKFTS
jgi:DNA-binding beta-propeller fold protein YncE